MAMKIYIDLSVLTNAAAVGRVHGELELAAVPPIGSRLVLSSPKNGVLPIQVSGFTGQLRICEILFWPVSPDTVSVSLMLDDVVVASISEGREVMKFLEDGFGLYVDEYERDGLGHI
jgi:hypothetical protein